MMNQSLKIAGVAALGAGVGFAIGYKVAEQRLAHRFDERLENETADMREFYTNVRQKYDTPEAAAAALIDREEKEPEDPREGTQRIRYDKIVKDEQYVDGDEGCEIEEAPIVRNVFQEAVDDSVPHIITQDTFMENETGYEQATLTYYSIGGVVADGRDDIIDNPKEVLGVLNDTHFGQGSSDPNVVHVRNHSIRMEFEVVKSERSYQQDVLGEDPTEVRQGR